MKKKVLIIASILTVVVVSLLCIQPWGKKPFKTLSINDMASVSVKLLPPQKSFDLTDDEISELTQILSLVVIYNKDNSYTEYTGQAVIYTITNKMIENTWNTLGLSV